jgi:hypothetical protein
MKALVLAAVAAVPAHAAEVHFCWQGNAGYALSGRMTFPDHLVAADRITETDVTAFDITGYRDGTPVGQWSLSDLGPRTSWNLNFLPGQMVFAVGGYSDGDNGQQWNASGDATDCGTPGFGFNAGASAQDICLNGQFIVESGISHDVPLSAHPADTLRDCPSGAQLSLLAASDQRVVP